MPSILLHILSLLLPEVIRLLGFSIAKQIIHLDIYWIGPSGVIHAPANQFVEPAGHVFVERTNAYAGRARLVHAPPVHAALFGIHWPFQFIRYIGYVMNLSRSLSIRYDRLRRTQL